MENFKGQEQSNTNSIKIENASSPQILNKILRSKSKNIYVHQKHIKPSNIQNVYNKQKISQNYNNMNNKPEIFKGSGIHGTNSNKYIKKNIQEENTIKKADLIQLKLLREENLQLKKTLKKQDEAIKELHNLFIHNYNKINSLTKKYSHLKRHLEKSMMEDDKENFLKEKIEEEFALRAVEQQIMDEICPNPDKMSYEQLLQLEEEVGIVNKGLSMDKIKEIPKKPFHKALFDDNCQCIICMENFTETELVKQLPCGHIFHEDCIDHWLTQQKNCPFCKAECIKSY